MAAPFRSCSCCTVLLYIRTYTAIPQLPRFPEGQNKSWLRYFFAQYCPNVRVILDCTEIRCEAPSSLTLQSETFSHYKNTNTFKGLIGIASCGVITLISKLISKLYTGSISDREITQQSGILSLLQPGDACMADKGFVIDKMLSEVGATLIMPPFKRGARLTSEYRPT